MPKGSPELTEQRKNEIIDACEAVYRNKGLQGVNIKEISQLVSLTRSSIYNYFETKEEILLGLLIREYGVWVSELQKIDHKRDWIIASRKIAESFTNREVLLRILNMNLYEIEINSRVERLAEFKKLLFKGNEILSHIYMECKSEKNEADCEIFCDSFHSFLFGVYPFTHHTSMQMEAMRMAGMELKEKSIYQMVYDYLKGGF